MSDDVADPLKPETRAFHFKIATVKLKIHKSPGIYHFPADVFIECGKECSF